MASRDVTTQAFQYPRRDVGTASKMPAHSAAVTPPASKTHAHAHTRTRTRTRTTHARVCACCRLQRSHRACMLENFMCGHTQYYIVTLPPFPPSYLPSLPLSPSLPPSLNNSPVPFLPPREDIPSLSPSLSLSLAMLALWAPLLAAVPRCREGGEREIRYCLHERRPIGPKPRQHISCASPHMRRRNT